jgi:putative nucleotidyltransferase with HDIG domain
MTDPREKRVELLLQQLDELPTLPAVAVKVLEATGRDDTSTRDVVRLLESDPSLTTRILALVRRADLGARGKVDTVDRAVALLGFDAVRSSVLALSVFQALNQNQTAGAGPFDRDQFWKHSVAVACCAELLATEVPASGVSPALAFTAGLLHDIGKVALDAMLPKSFNRVVEGADLLRGNIADLERTMIGLDHLTVGKRLCERWKLPEPIRDAAWLHGQLPDALPSTTRFSKLVHLVSLADLLVRRQHLGYSGNYVLCSPAPWVEALGIRPAQVDDVVRRLVGQIEPRAVALGLGQAGAEDLYRVALGQANKELGRIGDQLANKNRRLLARSKFFDALTLFQSELSADASPGTVLRAIGPAAINVLGIRNVAVFSLAPTADHAESILIDSAGQVFQTSLVDCLKRPPLPAPGDGPVLPAGGDLDWLLAMISPGLDGSHRFWTPLVADDACIGGVVWGGDAGEASRLGNQAAELTALAHGWSLAIRTAQTRDEARQLAEQLADSNRRLQSVQGELLRSRTMQAVGEMAAGAAHEINNPLAVISGRSQLLLSQLTDPKHRHAATLIHEQSQRVSQIISELMEFARPIPPALETADLADLIGRGIHDAKSVTETVDRRIETTVTDMPLVCVDPVQVSAAIAELVSNALQATDPVTGRVEIHAAVDPAPAASASTGSASAGVVLTITDNGVGMDEPTLRRAFDPFFSALPAGRRRGLGLAQALRWVEASGGTIRLDSRPGQGTRAVVLLPTAVSEPQTAELRPAANRAG